MHEDDRKIFDIIKRVVTGCVALIVVGGTIIGSYYTVSEGHVGIVTRWSKAIYQVDPGLHFKVPWIDGVEHIEVRQRRNTEQMSAATANQLPISPATVSINWTVHKEAAFDIFVKYGGLDQFESRILDPKFRQAAKAGLSKYTAAEIIRERDKAAATIQEQMVALMEDFPIDVNSPQIEDIQLPPQYMDAVMAKEQARENAVREQHNLDRQKLEAQQKVQTAEAERDARKAEADGNAYKIETEAAADAQAIVLRATAEAEGLAKIAEALSQNPRLIEYEQVKKWAGQVPSTVLGDSPNILYGLGTGR